MGVPSGHPSIRSFLGAPLLDRTAQVRGGLLLGHEEPDKFTRDDGECRKHRSSCRDKPDFIAIPEGADGIQKNAPLIIGLTEKWNEDAHSKVKPFKKEKTYKKEGAIKPKACSQAVCASSGTVFRAKAKS